MRGHVGRIEVQCLYKTRHSSRKGAFAEAKNCRVSGDVQTYKCPHCKGWHIGHATGRVLKRQFQGGMR